MNKEYKLICIDMFQTLVDVNTRSRHATQRMLKDRYTEALGQECWNEATRLVIDYFGSHQVQGDTFRTVKEGFEVCYQTLWEKMLLTIDPKESARILASEHGNAEPYEDAISFVKNVGRRYPICLVSDADEDMIHPLLNIFPFHKAFVSETHRCYKYDSALLRKAVEAFGVNPQEVLHIGDGYSDIFGAHGLGMDSCWINRHKHTWRHPVEPSYTVNGLKELENMLLIRNA